MLLRNPNEYKLVAQDGSDFENPISGYKHLMRLVPCAEIPEGFQSVESINGRSVFDVDGKLLPKFMALKRLRTGYI